MPDFVAQDITKEYPTPGQPLKILAGVNLQLDRGESVAVVGPSGSGKSTFLQIAGTLDQPSSGTLSLLNQDLVGMSEKQLAQFRNQNLGFIFQDHHLLPQLTALENVLIPVVARGAAGSAAVNRAKVLLDKVGLGDRAGHRPAQLSGGERQRVAVARALINEPAMVLADEPTGSLDPATAKQIGDLLLELQAEQNTILIAVTHSRELASTFQKQVRLDEGQFVQCQTDN
jgi:lipoprotein-releasing system ATP-binding protein